MIDKRVFSHAVALAAAFVANGDIRLGNTTREDSIAMDKVRDLVLALYPILRDVQTGISFAEGNGESKSVDPQSH